MAGGFIVVRPSPERDPDGSKLRETLQVQLAIERAHSVRELMVYVVAWLSVPMGLLAFWRGAPGPRNLVLAAWATSLAGVLVAGASEWKHHRRRSDLMAELGSPQAPGS